MNDLIIKLKSLRKRNVAKNEKQAKKKYSLIKTYE